jgi:hypothetical protein
MRRRASATIFICALALLGEGLPSAQSRSSKTWIGRYQEIEDYLRTAECVEMRWFAPNYSARCTLEPGGPVARMAWRPIVSGPPGVRQGFRENYHFEIVAYELDKLLGLDMVPPTVERQIQGTMGSAQQWVENIVDATDPAVPEGKDRMQWEGDVVRMTMFDMLMGNRARVRTNMLRDRAWNLILVDHSRAFGTEVTRATTLSAVDRALWTKIDALTRDQLGKALGSWLDTPQIDAMLRRRDLMRADVNSQTK